MTNHTSNKESTHQMADDELVSKFASTKADKYFEELYRRYSHLSFGVCMNLMKSEHDSRDVVSDVFRILYEKLPTANVQSFKSYLYAVSRNECIGRLRKQQTERAKMADLKAMQDKPLDFVENKKMLALLDREVPMEVKVEHAVKALRPEQQTCILLFFFEKKSYREIAEQTGYSEKQIKSNLQNGKRNLRIMLEKELKKLIV